MAEDLKSTPGTLSRRELLPAAAGLALAGCAGGPQRGSSPVFVAKAASYREDLVSRIGAGLKACGLDVAGKNILLKPNLVEFDASTAINTNVAVIAAAYDAFSKLGAASVRIGEGPGHRRDTLYLASQAEYPKACSQFERAFVDLNRDDVKAVKGFGPLEEIYLPETALNADLIVSLAKMKTHHWAGATLSMKNLFGLVPGSVYGWPKNQLHHVGIARSIVELNRIFRKTFAIVDGVVGMEGNGPVQGKPRPCGVLVMGPDLVAVDATCCRIMGINPDKISFLQMATELGNRDEGQIEQRGERIDAVRTAFELMPEFAHARLG